MRQLSALFLIPAILLGAAEAEAQSLAKQIFGAKETPTISESAAIGSYARGCLAGGHVLPEGSRSWQVMRPSRNRNWGHPELVAFINRLSAAAQRNGWPGLYVGDISQPRGGPMRGGHRSHQIGLDADIWLRRPDRMDLSRRDRDRISSTVVVASDGRSVNEHWTNVHHQVLKAAASDPAVARIFVNPAIKSALCRNERASDAAGRAWLRKIRPWTGHDAHFHVRLACPAGAQGCVDQNPVPAGDGCGADLKRWFSEAGKREVRVATRGIGKPELTLQDLPVACLPVAEAPPAPIGMTGADATASLGTAIVPVYEPPAPVVENLTAIYGIQGSRYLWVLPTEAGNDGESGMSLETAGDLPPGLALESGLNGRGIIEGVPTTPGNFAFQIIGRDTRGLRATYNISLEIEAQRTGGGTGGSTGGGVATGSGGGTGVVIGSSGASGGGGVVIGSSGGNSGGVVIGSSGGSTGGGGVVIGSGGSGGLTIGGVSTGSAGRSERAQDFLNNFNGGNCFYAHPVRVLASLSQIEVFSDQVDPLYRLDAAFMAALGFEARIGGRIVAPGHCSAVSFVKQVARGGVPAPTITLDDVTIGTGDYVSGEVDVPVGGSGVLIAVGRNGTVEIIAQEMRGSHRFSRVTHGPEGPHLLVALSLPAGQRPLALRELESLVNPFDRLLSDATVSGGRTGVAMKYFTVQ